MTWLGERIKPVSLSFQLRTATVHYYFLHLSMFINYCLTDWLTDTPAEGLWSDGIALVALSLCSSCILSIMSECYSWSRHWNAVSLFVFIAALTVAYTLIQMAITPCGGVQSMHCLYYVNNACFFFFWFDQPIPSHSKFWAEVYLNVYHAGIFQMSSSWWGAAEVVVEIQSRKKAEFTKCDKTTTVVGGKYLYGNSRFCQG